jgi:hypothetical protein
MSGPATAGPRDVRPAAASGRQTKTESAPIRQVARAHRVSQMHETPPYR